MGRSDFPDQMHVDHIRRALWRRREYGQAAVMVGAGFSLNARPISPSAPPILTWKQISTRLAEALYPKATTENTDREAALAQAASTSGALRLAQEYATAFGATALDHMLFGCIPENCYEPGPLHHALLRLPWSDVFTTNYDTLLERAKHGLVDRKYDVVLRHNDLPIAMKPRIVKLHGSFPATRPFIMTEEDYRTYPSRFAAFVNLVQQSMMENVFVLLGFSGDDPNFLYWTGWVRDNLGHSAPQIYLCDLAPLNTVRRDLLRDRNVVPIDLSMVVTQAEFPNEPTRYEMALKWLLQNLEVGEPPEALSWPRPRLRHPRVVCISRSSRHTAIGRKAACRGARHLQG